MDLKQSKALVEFGNLETLIKRAVRAANGSTIGLERDFEELRRTLVAERFSNLDFCLAASRIRERCKVDRNWMAVGKALAKEIIHRSYSTLDNMMRAAVKAEKLGAFLLAALIDEGIDPTEQKYDSLLDDLSEAGFSGTVGDARDVVRQALVKFRTTRKAAADQSRLAKITAEQDSPTRMRRLLKDRLRGVPPSKRNDAGLTLFHDILTAFQAEFSVPFLQHLLTQAAAEISQRRDHRQNREDQHYASISNQPTTTAPTPQSAPV